MYKKVTALLLAICLILTAAPTWVGAADTQAVSVGTASVYPGNSTSVTLRAENFQNIASLEVYLYYDPSVLTVSSTSNGSLLSGSQTSVNTAEAGKIKLVTMALDGINGSGSLLTVSFTAVSGCTPGTYPITVAIGGAYDSNLAAVNVSSTNGSITVLQQSQSETFSIYANYSKSTLQKGDAQQFRVCSNSSSRKFASADFTVTYDPEVFQFEDAVLGSALTGEGAVYSVNSSVLGQVRITYASSVPVSASYLFYVNLKVIADTNGSTQIKATANNVYKEDLSAYLPGSCSYSFTLKKLPEVVDHPNAFLRTQRLEVGKQCTSRFLLEAGAGVAAADFTLTYDPAVLRCVSVAAAEELGALGGMVIINDNYAEGKLRFSYINMNAYSETEVPIITVTWEPLQSPGTHYQITGSGVGVVDAQQKAVTLEYVTDTGCIYQPTVTPPTCLEDGCTTYACNACGDSYSVDPVEKLGHDITCYEAKEVTCTTVGWNAYETCSRCDHTTYVEIPALGHEEIVHEAQAQTCTGIGWESYVTCSRCDYTTYEEIPALGHRVLGEVKVQADPLEILNNSATPFLLTDGVYYSQNHADNSTSSMQIKVLHDCTVELIYGVSSETNYDWLSILRNNAQLDVISGSIANKVLAVSLVAGDVLTVRYSKDTSASTGTDRGWIELKYDPVWVWGTGDVSAETVEPTCTEAVICQYCRSVVKEALGHDEILHNAKGATCTEIGWNAYETCSRCDYTTYVEIPALGHNITKHAAQAATCTAVGWEAYETCSRCDYSTYKELPALGHAEVSRSAQAATCTKIGWEAYVTCSRCDYSTYQQLPALGHDLISHEGKEATGQENGWEPYVTCSRCDYSTYKEIPALGHDLISHEGKAPTCLEAGWKPYETCSRCDYTNYQEIPALGHDEILHNAKGATCTEIGWNAYETCSRCDYSTYKELPALGHAEVSHSAQAATCTAVGWEAYETCSRCDYSTYKELPALGHAEVSHSAQAATCTKIGWKAYVTCSRCDYSTFQQLPALGHDEIYHEGKEATGQENGWEPYVTCSRCDYSTYKEIPALGHDLISHEGKAPTCLEAGWEPYVTCSRCGYSNYKELPALGHAEVSHSAQAATCTAVGWEAYETCSRCDYSTYKEIPALGHAWTAMVETDETLRAEGKNCTQAHTYWNSCAHCQAVSDTLYFTGAATGPHSFTEQVKDDAHRVPGDPDRYYYDCAHCDTMGQETFGDQLRGDMDNDGDVDVDDAIYLLQHILMPGLFPIAQSGDISADGQSNVDDAIYLLQHVLMPGLFPLQ